MAGAVFGEVRGMAFLLLRALYITCPCVKQEQYMSLVLASAFFFSAFFKVEKVIETLIFSSFW